MDKQLFFLQRFIRYSHLNVSVNTKCIGVILPEHLYEDTNVMLQIGMGLERPIPDLEVNDNGLRGTMSFNFRPFKVSLPWDAVWLITTPDPQDGFAWMYCAPVLEVKEEPELQPTGSDGPVRGQSHPKPIQTTISPTAKTKKPLPAGWSVLDGGDKEPA